MAKQVKLGKGREFSFKAAGAQATKYAWDEWFTGDLLMLEQAVGTGVDEKGNITGVSDPKDFAVSIDAMIPKLKTAGRRRYKVIQVSRYDADGKRLVGCLIIKARPMDADERVAEEIRRAEDKEKLAAKKATSGNDNGDETDDDEVPAEETGYQG